MVRIKMPPLIEHYGMLFEWHDPKLDEVYNKREITLDEVVSVFFDEYMVTNENEDNQNEQQFITVGMSNKFRLLTVVWVQRGEVARIVTSFKASPKHKRSYNHAKRH